MADPSQIEIERTVYLHGYRDTVMKCSGFAAWQLRLYLAAVLRKHEPDARMMSIGLEGAVDAATDILIDRGEWLIPYAAMRGRP